MKTTSEISELIKKVKNHVDYMERPDVLPERKELNETLKEFIRRRMEHCASELEKYATHPETISTFDGIFIFYPNNTGHFSYPVYEALEKALSEDYQAWNALVWEQIVRQMWEEDCRDKHLFYLATECLLCRTIL